MNDHDEQRKDIEHGLAYKKADATGYPINFNGQKQQITLENSSSDNSDINEKSTISSSTTTDRGQWSTGIEFLLSCISMSVGLGNVWRFPYVAYENGGGAFLIPYLLLLFLIGRPIYFLELILGQFSGRGPIKVWKCVPALKGVGFAQLFSVSYVAIFYNYLMGISIYYFVSSFAYVLPWTECNEKWTDPGYCELNPNITNFKNKTWSELFFEQDVLSKSEGLWDVNFINWKLAFCLVVSWTLVYLSIVKGVTSLGKVAYFTAIFPYVVLLTLLMVSLSQDGAIEGIKYFFTPKFEKLLDPIVWYRAVEQSFFSLAVCFGSLVMYSSYNNFYNNVYRDAIIVSVLDTATSLLAGCVIFAVLGTMAKENNEPIENVVTKGMGLAFIAYPEGLSKIKFMPQLWSALFFVMLFTLGIGSSVAMVETILTCIKDQFEGLQKHKGKTALVFCILYMLLGLPLTTDAGSYIMSLLDNYGVGTAAFLYGILEVVGVIWIYGLKNFCADVRFMLGASVSIWWKTTWAVITPMVLIIIFIYGNVLIFLDYKTESGIPMWGTAIGWALAGIALLQIPLWFLVTVKQQKGASSLSQKIQLAFQPTNDWGPIDEETYSKWVTYKMEHSFKSNSKQSIFKDLDMDNEYRQHKSTLFVLDTGGDFKGSDNPGFVPDEVVVSVNNNFPPSSRNFTKSSFRKPRLLSKKNFDDNY